MIELLAAKRYPIERGAIQDDWAPA
jgi:hypothetical protein